MANIPHRAVWSGLTTDAEDADVAILGIPFDRAVSWRPGARFAPDRLRSLTPHMADSTEEGVPLTLTVNDYGNVLDDLNWERYFATVEARAVHLLELPHKLVLFIGGDHSIGIPLFQAFAQGYPDQPVGYIQFDAHADLAAAYEGHHWSHANTACRNLERDNLSPEHVAFVGLRSFLKEELEYYEAHPDLGWHTARSVYQRGIEAVAHEVVTQLKDVEAVYLSLDIDGFDPASAPGTGTPEHGGLSVRQGLEFLRIVFAGLPIKAMDLVEVSPPLDHADVTSLAALKVIYELFGFVQQRS